MNKEKLKGIVRNFYDDYRRTLDEGDKEYRNALKGGDVVGNPGTKIYGKNRRADFDERASNARAAADEVFNAEFCEIDRKKTEAPSADAAAVISMMKGRDNVSPDEVRGLLERYGGNYMAYHALADVAAKNNIKGIDRHSLDERQENLEGLWHSISRALTTIDAERHGAGAFEAVLCSMIDDCQEA